MSDSDGHFGPSFVDRVRFGCRRRRVVGECRRAVVLHRVVHGGRRRTFVVKRIFVVQTYKTKRRGYRASIHNIIRDPPLWLTSVLLAN